jgi:hypothetical protein
MLRTPNRPHYTRLPEPPRRCKATHIHKGRAVRCHDVEGHKSVHYTREVWWPNKPQLGLGAWLAIATVALGLAGLAYKLWTVLGLHQ